MVGDVTSIAGISATLEDGDTTLEDGDTGTVLSAGIS